MSMEIDVILAEGNTYEQRDELKARGFRWSAANKAWWMESTSANDKLIDELAAELEGVRFRWAKAWNPYVRMAS